jgi:uncharacterized protein YbaP (TraB family)
MYYTDDTMLKDKVSPEVYAQLKAMFDEYGLPAIAYEKLRPWAAAMMASQLDVQAEGYAGEQGIDLYFMNKAAGEGKEILELESVSDQIKIFENMEEIFGNSFLEYTLQDMKDTTDQIGEFFKVWKNGDTKKFEELYNESIKDFPNKEKFDKYLMIDRNYKMAEKIDAFIKRGGTYFVVVGAGHLIGPESVVKLLEKKNYKLKQL